MMPSDEQTVSFKTSASAVDEIDAYKAREGHSTRSDALRDLVGVGLRETKSPILGHLRPLVMEWAGHLGLTAIAAVVAGFTTSVFAPAHGLQIAVVLIVIAVGLIGAVELARAVNGQSELGEQLHQLRN